jgi:two-component system NtrC family response regulator
MGKPAMHKKTILVVDDEPNSLFVTSQILVDQSYQVITADNGTAALNKLKAEKVNVVITDERMPGISGMEVLRETKKYDSRIPVIILTGYGTIPLTINALRDGAFYFFEKPVSNNLQHFYDIIEEAIKTQTLQDNFRAQQRHDDEKSGVENILGKNKKMLEVFKIVEQVAPTDKTILIQGESGTGKELIARAIHNQSFRKNKKLVTVNCAALTDTLVTSELFGHNKGAFTGAMDASIGRFELAHGGTLFLDEIGETSPLLQKTLLRVIQEKEFEKVGGGKTIKVDFRLVCSTNRDLKEEVEKGDFRKDLYYRLNIVPITLPPLRDRKADIPVLVTHFLKKYEEQDKPVTILPEVMEHLKEFNYSWPGNVRELENVIQQMMVFCKDQTITIADLPPHLLLNGDRMRDMNNENISLTQIIEAMEKEYIGEALKRTDWHRENAARLLGITRKMLGDRISKYGLKKSLQQ